MKNRHLCLQSLSAVSKMQKLPFLLRNRKTNILVLVLFDKNLFLNSILTILQISLVLDDLFTPHYFGSYCQVCIMYGSKQAVGSCTVNQKRIISEDIVKLQSTNTFKIPIKRQIQMVHNHTELLLMMMYLHYRKCIPPNCILFPTVVWVHCAPLAMKMLKVYHHVFTLRSAPSFINTGPYSFSVWLNSRK